MNGLADFGVCDHIDIRGKDIGNILVDLCGKRQYSEMTVQRLKIH